MGDDGEMYVVVYDNNRGAAAKIHCSYTQGVFHGTGDTFTSVLSARLLHGDSLEVAAKAAADFVSEAIAETAKYPDVTTRDGILFEKELRRGDY
jgi:pyridoxine kinase